MEADADLQRGMNELIADLYVDLDRSQRAEAVGWCYVVVDDDSGKHVHVVGLFETPEAALLASEEQKREDVRMAEGDPLWTHHVLPVFP